MIFYTYVLVSEARGLRFYVGMTSNLEKRIVQHNSGETFSTRSYRPWKLFFYESYPDRKRAREREIHLKGGSGKEKIKRDWAAKMAK